MIGTLLALNLLPGVSKYAGRGVLRPSEEGSSLRVPTFHCWLRERGTRHHERAFLWLAPWQKICSPEKNHVHWTSYLCKSKLNFKVIIILTTCIKKLKEDQNNLKLKTLSGLLCLDQTLQNFHLVIVLRLLLNCYLYLRFGQCQLISQKWITIWGRNWTF